MKGLRMSEDLSDSPQSCTLYIFLFPGGEPGEKESLNLFAWHQQYLNRNICAIIYRHITEWQFGNRDSTFILKLPRGAGRQHEK